MGTISLNMRVYGNLTQKQFIARLKNHHPKANWEKEFKKIGGKVEKPKKQGD